MSASLQNKLKNTLEDYKVGTTRDATSKEAVLSNRLFAVCRAEAGTASASDLSLVGKATTDLSMTIREKF